MIDTRLEDESAAVQIPDALHLAPGIGELRDGHGMREPAAFAKLAESFGIDEHVIVVLDDDHGPTACQSVWGFRYYGHVATSFLDGGLTKWIAEECPLSTEGISVTSRTFTPQFNESTYCARPGQSRYRWPWRDRLGYPHPRGI